jgi:hypothetical protein
MVLVSLTLALALALAPPATPESPELPSWRELPETEPPEPRPEARPEPPPRQQLVPSNGAGLLTLGSMLLGTGATLGITAIVQTSLDDPRTRSGRELAAVMTGPLMGAGIVTTVLGLVIRRQFRASPAAAIRDAPRTGNGMLLGGIGLLLGGTAFAAEALVDLNTLECSDTGCFAVRPIGAPLQLGLALAGVAVGTGLVVPGVRRRLAYRTWAKQRLELQPRVGASATSLSFGLVGRF